MVINLRGSLYGFKKLRAAAQPRFITAVHANHAVKAVKLFPGYQRSDLLYLHKSRGNVPLTKPLGAFPKLFKGIKKGGGTAHRVAVR